MDANDIAKAIELGKSLDDLKKLKSDIQEAKLEKAKLEKNIVILKKANAEEQQEYEQDKKERDEQIRQLESNIKLLEAKRSNLATSAVPEVKRLEGLKAELAKTNAGLEKKQSELDTKYEVLSKREGKIEGKKEVLAQIVKLTQKL